MRRDPGLCLMIILCVMPFALAAQDHAGVPDNVGQSDHSQEQATSRQRASQQMIGMEKPYQQNVRSHQNPQRQEPENPLPLSAAWDS